MRVCSARRSFSSWCCLRLSSPLLPISGEWQEFLEERCSHFTHFSSQLHCWYSLRLCLALCETIDLRNTFYWIPRCCCTLDFIQDKEKHIWAYIRGVSFGPAIFHNLTEAWNNFGQFWTPGLLKGVLSNHPCLSARPSLCVSVFKYLRDRSLVFFWIFAWR